MAADHLAIKMLGPVELWRGSRKLSAGRTLRAVVAMLALRAGDPVASETLTAGIWGEDDEPLAGSGAIQVSVSRIRALLRPDHASVIRTVSGGYVLERDAVSIDSRVFEAEVTLAREHVAANRAESAVQHLETALGLWRGPALMDLRDFPFAAHVADRLEELRVDAAEELFAARLLRGEHQEVVAELHDLLEQHPYRERLASQLMLALYRGGQPATALDVFTRFRRRLVLDLGVEPGAELGHLQQQILARDPEIDIPSSPSEPADDRALSRAPVAGRIPPHPVVFGRDTLLKELENLAASERLITLIGPGGSGKTTVAIALLHRLAPSFPDGAAFVDLAPEVRAAGVLPAIAAALGISQSGTPLRVRLAEVLAESRTVLVLDNFEHLTDAVPDLPPLLAATKGLLVVTSRTPLGLRGERLVPVPPLDVPDVTDPNVAFEPAVRLFLRTASNGGIELTSDDLHDISRICRAVDGLPLAIELAAAQTRLQSVAEIAEGIDERLATLSTPSRDVPDRQRTMEAAISWSLSRLPESIQAAFSVLSVFGGPFAVSGASALLQLDRAAAIDVLSALLDASLLQREPSHGGQARFRMLQPLRVVAKRHAAADLLHEAAMRHAGFVASEVDRLAPWHTGIQTPQALTELRTDHLNIVAAIQHLVELDAGRAVELTVQLVDYWSWTGQEPQAVDLLKSGLTREGVPAPIRCLGYATLAILAARLGHAATAGEAMAAGLAESEAVEDPLVRARLQLADAHLGHMEGDPQRAQTSAREALALARRTEQPWIIGQCASMLALSYLFPMWKPDAAESTQIESWLEEGLRAATTAPAPLTEVELRLTLIVYLSRVKHNLAQAEAVARSALNIVRGFDSPELAAAFANHLGLLAVRRRSISEGRLLILMALQTLVRIGPRVDALAPLGSLAEVEAARGRWRNAMILSHAATALAKEMGDVRYASLDPEEEAAIREAEGRLGPHASNEARVVAQAMTYREAVRFALEINGIR